MKALSWLGSGVSVVAKTYFLIYLIQIGKQKIVDFACYLLRVNYMPKVDGEDGRMVL